MKAVLPCVLIATCAFAQAQENPAQEAARLMVQGEGNFFQASQEHGTRAAFLQFLAEDAIVFQPGPVNGREAWTKRPEKGIALSWKPLSAAMARSADLGYTTGPAEWRKAKEDEKPFGYGQFVSIWRKQKDGSWKVVLDVGSEVPGPPKSDEAPQLEFSFGPNPVSTNGSQISPSKELHEAESKFAAAAQADSAAALLAASSAAVRVHRENAFPAVGQEAAREMLSARGGKLTLERMGGGGSAAGDLAYSYGKYALTTPQNAERGHYLQIWRTDEEGRWQIALDYQAPLPPEEEK